MSPASSTSPAASRCPAPDHAAAWGAPKTPHIPFDKRRVLTLSALFAATVLVAGCGGGGGGGGSSPFPPSTSGGPTPPAPAPAPTPSPAAATAQLCAPTNPYRADADVTTTLGSLDNEKAWLNTYLTGAYLWYSEMPTVDAGLATYSNTADVYTSLDNYFNAQLTPALTASGKRRDAFSFIYPTKQWNDLAQSGAVSGYGIEWYFGSSTPPRGLRIVYVEAGSPAAAAGLQRGDTLVTADGVSADVATTDGVNTLNAALFPSANGQAHSFSFTRNGSPLTRTLTSATVIKQTVPKVQVLNNGGSKVGYMVFTDHLASAEQPLIDAINTLKAGNVTDLVLDLRYNGGGYLYIASELAYMIAGPSATSGQVFEQLQYNSKRTADTNSADARTPFYDSSCILDSNFNCSAVNPLPTLGLSRVSILTTGGTCSASEAIINGLRGVGIDVRLIGETTCGKPYGFTAKDNCGISYFPIEFKGVNAQGYGDYADGFGATCAASDDLDTPLGDPSENQLAGALYNLSNNTCNPASFSARKHTLGASRGGMVSGLLRGPERENRIVLAPKR
ncbi:MAG TPA: S41 family peptidase [Ideonella sp.]|nr:S41 family peptidase [Ideonella sp.]